LRGVAILLVVVAHATTGVWPAGRGLGGGRFAPVGAGFVGVQLFFVLSGFLITSILVRERDRTQHVELGRFYLRRVALACSAVLMYATSVRWLRNGVLVWFGTISYGLYLWHYFILQLGPPPLVGIGISVAIAAASWYGVERRFLKPRDAADAPTPMTS
jgi:peptidoglycan/LPS O-acetylase OafA/YrhL